MSVGRNVKALGPRQFWRTIYFKLHIIISVWVYGPDQMFKRNVRVKPNMLNTDVYLNPFPCTNIFNRSG